jgi:hypothetical protein
MAFLAEELPSELAYVFFIPVVCFGLALISFWPSWRGHWAGPLLATPAVLVGARFAWWLANDSRKDELLPGLWAYALGPLGIGLASLFLWVIRRLTLGEK